MKRGWHARTGNAVNDFGTLKTGKTDVGDTSRVSLNAASLPQTATIR
jgi:hypothetical protein